MKDGNGKLNKLEKYWVLYDVGNSAFVLLMSTIIPIYYKNMASSEGISLANSTAYYSYAISIATIIVAILGPILGTMADNKGMKKIFFTSSMMMGVLACAALSIPTTVVIFLASFTMLASSCSSDDDLNKEAPAEEYVTKAKDILSGDIVLSTKATMSGVDKTSHW